MALMLYLTVESLLSCCGFDSSLRLRFLVDPNIIYICALSNTSLSLSLSLHIYIYVYSYIHMQYSIHTCELLIHKEQYIYIL